MSEQEIKTKFKGPGQWRTQAAALEREEETVEDEQPADD